jgi:hypothetical protein
VQLTNDGGKHWKNVTPTGLPPWSRITMLEASPFDAATAYAAVDRHRLDDVSPWIFRTRDAGAHWTRIESGIAPNSYAQVVRADPVKRGLLYAGTELGAYVSFDDGDHWRSLQLNLPVASIRDLVVHDNDLVAATHGRSFWILDDVTILEQLNDSVMSRPVTLFKPARAVRIRRSVSDNTPVPPEEPHGFNPPAGAVIDYWLREAPKSPVVIEILDARGRIVRRYSSAGELPKPTAPPQIAPNWLEPRPQPPTANAGHNRFVWDLRYPPPPAEMYAYTMQVMAGEGAETEPMGPLVLPGSYRVRLIVGSDSLVRALTVVNDPRVKATAAALRSQTALALWIWNAENVQFALEGAAHTLIGSLRTIPAATLDSGARAAITNLKAAADSLEHGMGDDLANILATVESADREPTQQSRDAYKAAMAKLMALMKRWDVIASTDLPRLNSILRAREFTPVDLPAHEYHGPPLILP